jgi:ADP-ribose pyrophosphatase YjhB (NUDIX family)
VERELLEETGLEVGCGAFLGWAERQGEGFHFVILDFEVSLSGRPSPEAGGDAVAAAWVPLSEVAGLPLVDGLQEFLAEHGVLPGNRRHYRGD